MPLPPATTAEVTIPAVRFDHAAAASLAAALDGLAHELRVAATRAERRADAARRDWTGCTRRWFEDELAALVHGLRSTAATAEADACAVRGSSRAAVAEQHDIDVANQTNATALDAVATSNGVTP